MAAEYYRPDRGDATATPPEHQRARRRDGEHGPNGFDLHALSGQPLPLHRLPADPRRRLRARAARRRTTSSPRRCGAPAPAVVPPGSRPATAEFARPADLAEALALLAEQPGRHGDRRLHGLGRRGQPARHPRPVRGRRRPAARAAHVLRRRRRRRDRRRAHPVRGRAAARRAGAAARPAVAAVRLPADPQRRHPRRQPRHRLPHRRRAARAARARGVGGAGVGPSGEREVPLAVVLHRLPRRPSGSRAS